MNNSKLYLTNEALDNSFEGFNEFNTDLTLDNVNPWMLLAAYTGAVIA